MGLFSDILDSFSGKSSSDPKEPSVSQKEDEDIVRVRNSDVLIDHDTGKHDMVWSNTTVNVNTGESKSDEGAHGPNFKD